MKTSTLTPLSVSKLSLYNPARMSDEDIIASFAARQAMFNRILADIAAEKQRSRAQHHLIVGQRGMGKSTLLARLAAELRQTPELSAAYVPLVFAEEQYAVDRLSKFWLNCLDSLADACERSGNSAAVERIDSAVRRLTSRTSASPAGDDGPATETLEAFLAEAKAVGRRPVLLVDNLQLVFERLAEQQQHVLRELLMRPGGPLLVGASPSPPLETRDYGAAFYDHFKVHYLPPLSVEEMRQLMLTLADKVGRTDVRDRVVRHPHRLSVLCQLTGGNPRTTVTLFFLYAEDFAPSVFGDLENLLDRVTPLYKSRFEELSAQQQVVASAIANHWDPVTARKLAEVTGLPITGVSSQLDRLEKTGFVERVSLFGESSAGFQISERFFNVWFLMRSASRRQRREVEFLTRFIESFYEAQDRSRLASHLQSQHDFSPDRHLFARALACTLDPPEARDLQRHTELDALRQTEIEARRKLEEVIDFSQLQPAALDFHELRKKLSGLVPRDAGVKPEQFAEQVLGDRRMFQSGDRARLASQEKLSENEIRKILASVRASRKKDCALYGKSAVDWLAKRLSSGQLTAMDNLGDWNAAFRMTQQAWSMNLMVNMLPPSVGARLDKEVVLKIHRFLLPDADASAMKWFAWGIALHSTLRCYSEAEAAYRRAIALDPEFPGPWNNLGNLLKDCMARHEEAEAAYLRAIALDPKFAAPWINMGNLLQEHFGRCEKAELAYRQAIALDGKSAAAWNNLGALLASRVDRPVEAEAAYRRAIALDEKYSQPWNNLGCLFHDRLFRYEEAEAAYRRAIALDEKYASPWLNLGRLFQFRLGRAEESESAYRQAIARDAEDGVLWRNLGNLLQSQLQRYEEAATAFRRAIALDEKDAGSWNSLGNLYCDHLSRYSEAAEALEKAADLNPDEEAPVENLTFLHRDFLGEGVRAQPLFQNLLKRPIFKFPDVIELHHALFAAYEENWGQGRDALSRALSHIEGGFPALTAEDWPRTSAVLLHLNYGEALLILLRERGEDARLRPWYEAIAASQTGDRRRLQNLAPEIRTTAEIYFDQIEKRLNALPASTRRRPLSKSSTRPSRRRSQQGAGSGVRS